MTTANWITLIITLVGLAVTAGGLMVRVKVVEERAKRTADDFQALRERQAASRGDQGERIGVVEERIATLEGALGIAPRRLTRGGGYVIPPGAEGHVPP